MIERRRRAAANSTYKKLAVQWLNKHLCFVSSSLVADSFRLRNRQLLVAANRWQKFKKTTVKYLTVCICGLLLLCSCAPTENKIAEETILADTSRIDTIQPTDSILLLRHLDSLPKITFPFLSEFYNRNFSTVIDLQEFKDKRLFNLPFKRIEREAGGGSIDYEPDDSTFNLTDNDFKAQWNLIAKTPKFIVLEVYTGYAFFVTITYDLSVIDAIRSGYADPAGNVHWHADRHSIINNDLTILLQHYYEVQVDEKYNYDSETTEEKWLIDSNGHFKQK